MCPQLQSHSVVSSAKLQHQQSKQSRHQKSAFHLFVAACIALKVVSFPGRHPEELLIAEKCRVWQGVLLRRSSGYETLCASSISSKKQSCLIHFYLGIILSCVRYALPRCLCSLPLCVSCTHSGLTLAAGCTYIHAKNTRKLKSICIAYFFLFLQKHQCLYCSYSEPLMRLKNLMWLNEGSYSISDTETNEGKVEQIETQLLLVVGFMMSSNAGYYDSWKSLQIQARVHFASLPLFMAQSLPVRKQSWAYFSFDVLVGLIFMWMLFIKVNLTWHACQPGGNLATTKGWLKLADCGVDLLPACMCLIFC